MGVVIKEGELDFQYDEKLAVSARVGTFGPNRLPVTYLAIGKDRTLVLDYDTLNKVLDLLCQKKEILKEKILGRVEIPTGKIYKAMIGR